MTSGMNSTIKQQAPGLDSALSDWLAYLEQLHSTDIDLGLERLAVVDANLRRGRKPARFVITVAGTNGKGSTVCYLSTILQQAGYAVGVYSSPHMTDYRERVLVNGQMLSEQDHVAAFDAVERARGDTSLTYFEFGTLAALHLMQQQPLDVAILEVGLGGRLDAVNIVDADVAVITRIGIDHIQFLGDNREQIGFEKAGIARADKALVCGDPQPPKSIAKHAREVGAKLYQRGQQFSLSEQSNDWHYRGIDSNLMHLPLPQLPLQNAATSLAALECLPLAVSADAINQGLRQAQLMGRMQLLDYKGCEVLLDVGHNPQAAEYLAEALPKRFKQRSVYAVVGMLKDKDHAGVFTALAGGVSRWYLGSLNEPRGNSAAQLASALTALDIVPAAECVSVEQAFEQAVADAAAATSQSPNEKPLVFVFGSFYTVGRIHQQIRS